MRMSTDGGFLGVPAEHLPGLLVLLLFPVLAWAAYAILRRRAQPLRLGRWPLALPREPGARFAVWALLLGGTVHAALVPTHWGDSRTLAVLFLLDAAGFVALAFAALAGVRYWRPAAAAALAATAVGYGLFLVRRWETADIVGIATTAVELAGAAMVLAPRTLLRPRWAAVPAAVVLSAVLVLGTSSLAGAGPGSSPAALSLATASPAGPIQWPPPAMQMEPGMVAVDADCQQEPTPSQQQAAVSLVNRTSAAVVRYQSLAAAQADGYVPVTPTGRAVVHYIKPQYLVDGRTLDPTAVESLVYANTPRGAILVAAMYAMPVGSRGQAPPTPGGCLTRWHRHTDLCFAGGAVVGTDDNGPCPAGSTARVTQPMIHVWLAPVPGGPLSVDASNQQVVHAAGQLRAPAPPNRTA